MKEMGSALKHNNEEEDQQPLTGSQPVYMVNGQDPAAQLIGVLQEKNAVLKSFMERTPNMAWVVDENVCLQYASRKFYEIFGLEESDAVNKSIPELMPADLSETLFEKHQHVLATGEQHELLQDIKWADGSTAVYHINIFPINDCRGKKLLGGHAVNLTEKNKAEAELRKMNERLLMLSRATSDAIWEWDMQTGQIYRNEALMEMTGFFPQASRGLSWWLRRIHPEDRTRVGETVRKSTEAGLFSWQEEYRFKCADGTYKPMRDKGFIVYENGLPVKMIGSIQDNSDIKEMESRLIQERLQRQKELTDTIIQAQERERTRIGMELHDNVNQILSSAKLFLEMLQPAGKEQTTVRQKGLDYISLAVEEIRKLSRELVTPVLRENNLVACIRQLLEDVRVTTRIETDFRFDNCAELLSGDKKITLFRIIQEQLKNIIKHSGAIRVELALHCTLTDVVLEIRDNGKGFDPNQTFRGIGLSSIYERTRYYEGNAEMLSAPGNGCTLRVSLPL